MMIKNKKLRPLLKYPGGKERELKYINNLLPSTIKNYYEPFLGGGAVYFNIKADHYYVNDKSQELIDFYKNVAKQDTVFFEKLASINYNWKLITEISDNHSEELLKIFYDFYNDALDERQLNNLLFQFVIHNVEEFNGLLTTDFNVAIEDFINILKKTLLRKYKRMKVLSKKSGVLEETDIKDNIESALKASFYTHLRNIQNNSKEFNISNGYSSALYFFIRQTCYSSMFRYNKSGGFNVPYGGISYNKMNFDKHLDYFSSEELMEHFSKTTFGNKDFYDFMKEYEPQIGDFIFVDPPYDSEFSTYSNNEFLQSDQERLADYLINTCKGNFMLVIKNTELISNLYVEGTKTANQSKIYISSFDKKYSVSFKNRNNKKAEHLVITNYET